MKLALLATLILHNATIIDGTTAPPRPRADVVIQDQRIVALRDAVDCQHGDAQVVDASGKYVLPGFIDMHAHLLEHERDEKGELKARVDWKLTRLFLQLLLDHGVTTIRDPGSETEAIVTLRTMLANGRWPGPRAYVAGRIVNASKFNPEPFQPVVDADDIRREIEWQAAAGVDFIKIYASMPPELTKVAIDEAHARGLRVIGHLHRTTWAEAARLGIDFIAHGANWAPAYLAPDVREKYDETMYGRVFWLEHIDLASPVFREMFDELVRHRVVIDPTLIAFHTKFQGDLARWRENPDLRLMPAAVITGWRAGNFTRDWTPEQYAAGHKAWPRQLALVKAMYDAGVRLTVGTDTPTAWIVPGASFHEELTLLRDAGIPPAAILRMATHDAAVALGGGDEFGAVLPGLRADLIVLARNPLEKIENTRSIELVFQNGRMLPRKRRYTDVVRPKTRGLTDAELRVMNVLWAAAPAGATVAEVQKKLKRERLAYTTILTTIQVLASKGYVGHRAEGRAYRYHALVERGSERLSAVRQLIAKWFDNSPDAMVSALVAEDDLTPETLDEIARLIREKKKKAR